MKYIPVSFCNPLQDSSGNPPDFGERVIRKTRMFRNKSRLIFCTEMHASQPPQNWGNGFFFRTLFTLPASDS